MILILPESTVDHLGDLNALDRNSCKIHNRDLVLSSSTDCGVLDQVAQFKNGTLFNVPSLNRTKTLAVINTLWNAVRDD